MTFKSLDTLYEQFIPEEIDQAKVKAQAMSASLRLAEIRKAQNLTQGEIAEKMGVSQASISKIEQRNNVQLSTLIEYAHALGSQLNVEFVLPNGEHVKYWQG